MGSVRSRNGGTSQRQNPHGHATIHTGICSAPGAGGAVATGVATRVSRKLKRDTAHSSIALHDRCRVSLTTASDPTAAV